MLKSLNINLSSFAEDVLPHLLQDRRVKISSSKLFQQNLPLACHSLANNAKMQELDNINMGKSPSQRSLAFFLRIIIKEVWGLFLSFLCLLCSYRWPLSIFIRPLINICVVLSKMGKRLTLILSCWMNCMSLLSGIILRRRRMDSDRSIRIWCSLT